MTRILALSALLLSFGTGCTPIVAGLILMNGPEPTYDEDFGNRFTESATGTMRGEMEAVGEFDRAITQAAVWQSPFGFDFDLHATDGDWAMLSGGVDGLELEPGDTVNLGPNDHWIIGCSGPTEYDAVFDDSAEDVEISMEAVVVDDVEMHEITITAWFSNGSEVTAVVVQPRPQPEEED